MKMGESRKTHLVKPCDICGDVGFEESIATCCECKVAREHVYCMRVLLMEIPETWVCEECHSGDETGLPTSITKKFSSKCNFRKPKSVESGRVKFIPIEEAIAMTSSVAMKPVSRFSSTLNSASSVSRSSVTFKKANFTYRPSGQMKPLRHGHPDIRKIDQLGIQELKAKQTLENVTKDETKKSLLDIELKSSGKEVKKTIRDALPIISSGNNFQAEAEPRIPDVEGKPCTVTAKREVYLPNHPALDAVWKGDFNISSYDSDLGPIIYAGLCAHLPFRVHRKVNNFSMTIPSVLQFNLLPRLSVWDNIFMEDCPNSEDIGLYILPGDTKRSKERYVSLVELLIMHDLGMTSSLGNVDFLIFTSRHLHAMSQRLNRKYFLWGLFHHRISNRDDAVQDNHAVMDMEIDMVGGKCVGGTDMVVPKNLNYTTPQAVCRIKTESVEEPDFPPGFTPKARSKFAFEGTKFSDKMDILPGFEGRIRSSKLQGKFCSTDGKILSPQYIKKPIEDSVSADQPVRHQIPSHGMSVDRTAAFPSPTSRMETGTCSERKVCRSRSQKTCRETWE